jgi:hypothetical protein
MEIDRSEIAGPSRVQGTASGTDHQIDLLPLRGGRLGAGEGEALRVAVAKIAEADGKVRAWHGFP